MNPTTPNPDIWSNWSWNSSNSDEIPNQFTQQPITDNPTITKPEGEKKEESGR